MDEERGKLIYKNIQTLAYAKGMTIQKMCKEAGVSPGIIGDLNNGRRSNIGKVTVQKLTDYLGCSEEDIFSDSDKPMPKKATADRSQGMYVKAFEAMKERPELRRLVRAAMKASPQQVRSTAILLESITQVQLEGGMISDDDE